MCWYCWVAFWKDRSSQKSRLLARAGTGCARGLELLTETRLCVSFRDSAASLAKPCSGPEEEAFFCRVKTKMPMEDREGGSSVTGSLVLAEEHHTWCVLCISAVREVGVRWQQGVGKALDVQRWGKHQHKGHSLHKGSRRTRAEVQTCLSP